MNENTLEVERNAIQNAYAYSRVSAARQLKGTGMSRQQPGEKGEGKPEQICREHGWILSPQTFADLGVSAFKGKNRLKGDLATFVELANEKKLLPNPVLILEQWDRFSRQELDESFDAVRDLLRSGVAIHISFGNHTFTKACLNSLASRIGIELALQAAWEYSANLSRRVKAAYDKKKESSALSGKAYRFKAPGWLKWNKQTEAYDTIPEKVMSIKRLFELANMGIGVRGITKRLNTEHVLTIGTYNGDKIKSGNWSCVVVAGLIHSQKVLGVNANVSPPVKMYPQVISDEVYYAAKAKVDQRRTGRFFGRNSDEGRNLFLHLAACKKCGRLMSWHGIKTGNERRNPETAGSRGGTGARGGKPIHAYLICQGFVAGTCTTNQIVYEWMEESFVGAISCSVSSLTLADSNKPVSNNDSEMLKGQLAETQALLGKYTAVNVEVPTKAGAIMIKKQEDEETRLLADLERATTIELGSTPMSEAKQELMGLMYRDWSATDTRLRARELIRTLVEKIVVDIAKQSYKIHWKGFAKPTEVELVKRGVKGGARLTGYTINGTYYPSMGKAWRDATADIARYAKDMEAEPLPVVP